MTPLPAQFVEWLKASYERFARFRGRGSHHMNSQVAPPTRIRLSFGKRQSCARSAASVK